MSPAHHYNYNVILLSHSFESLHKFWAGAKDTEVVLSEVRVNASLYGR